VREINVAVISDLHCHHSRKFLKTETPLEHSHLSSDMLNMPIKDRPIYSLIDLLNKETPKQKFDFLLCPGDITHQVDLQGFISGWQHIKTLGRELGAEIVATLGNHDVDSRYNLYPHDVFYIARRMGSDFPFKTDNTTYDFWSDGISFIEFENVKLLVINTVKFHTNKDLAARGIMEDLQLEKIEAYLEKKPDDKIKIALCHHHPIPHTRGNLGSEDLIELGSELVDKLNKYQFDLLIHGHKHDPWLRYSHGTNETLPIFSAGSFSFKGPGMMSGARNTFHTIRIIKDGNNKALGHIKTWEFLPFNGWRLADSGDHYFPPHSGFGYNGRVDDLVTRTKEILQAGNGEFIPWSEFIKQLSDVEFLVPEECHQYRDKLRLSNIITNPEFPKLPEIIGKLYKS